MFRKFCVHLVQKLVDFGSILAFGIHNDNKMFTLQDSWRQYVDPKRNPKIKMSTSF